jgi:hypothetical protein
MSFTAISIGYAVPTEGFDAAVHSAFHSALNLRLRGHDGLLTLLAANEGDLPQGIRLNTPKDFSFEDIQAGEEALCRDGILHFKSSSLAIQLSGARHWKCNLPALGFDPTKPAVSAAWDFVWHLLNKRQKLSGSEIVAGDLFHVNKPRQASVSDRVGEAMRDLINSTRRYKLSDVTAVNSLIGLGSGLTPSGDDLLVGYMAGLWCAIQQRSDRTQFISSLGKTIIQLSYKTNNISRTYLCHATQGQVSSHLANLAESICRGDDTRQLDKIAETAMSVGHTSGMDAVSGLLLGLGAWEGNQLKNSLE